MAMNLTKTTMNQMIAESGMNKSGNEIAIVPYVQTLNIPSENPIDDVSAEDAGASSDYQYEDITDPSLLYWLEVSSVTAVIVPVLFGIVFLVGVIGNATLIFTVIRNKCMRNAPNYYIVSLAAGDLILILIAVPFKAAYYTLDDWPFGVVMCKLVEYLKTFSLGVSVFTLTALSADRYSAIVNPMAKHLENPIRRTVSIIVLIWIAAAILAIPDGISYHEIVIPFSENSTECDHYCNPFPDALPWYAKFTVMFQFSIYFAIPLVTIGVFYYFMARVLIASSERIPGDSSYASVSNVKRQMRARRKVARIVFFFVIIFLVCWLPYHITLIQHHFSEDSFSVSWDVFKIFSFCLSFIYSCVNPLSLYFLSKQFRGYFQSYLFCCVCKKRERPTNHSVSIDNVAYNAVRRSSTTMTIVRSTSHNLQGQNAHYNVTSM